MSLATPKTRKEKQSDRTRRALLAAARELFTARGYAATSTEEVVRRAGMTRGALYHQFRDKRALFEALLDDVAEEAWEQGREISRQRTFDRGAERGSFERQLAALEVVVEGFVDPSLQRLLFVEAPAVLGVGGARRVTERHFTSRLRGTMAAAKRRGVLDPEIPERLPDLLLAAVVEAGRLVAQAEDPERTHAEVAEAVLWLWRRLQPSVAGAPAVAPEAAGSKARS